MIALKVVALYFRYVARPQKILSQVYVMEFNSQLLRRRRVAIGMAFALVLFSELAMAGKYQSSVVLPTVSVKNYTYTANLPVLGAPPASGKISNVSWAWSFVGWPKGLVVYLCHGSIGTCYDISRQRSGSTRYFNNKSPSQRFFYAVKIGGSGIVPVAGQQGTVSVSW